MTAAWEEDDDDCDEDQREGAWLGDGAVFDDCLAVGDAAGAGHGAGVDSLGERGRLVGELGGVVDLAAYGIDRDKGGPWGEEGVFEAEIGDFGDGVFSFGELGVVGEVSHALAGPEGAERGVVSAGFGDGLGEVEALAPSLAAAGEAGNGDLAFGLAGPLGGEGKGSVGEEVACLSRF